jgi:hypothetical protein
LRKSQNIFSHTRKKSPLLEKKVKTPCVTHVEHLENSRHLRRQRGVSGQGDVPGAVDENFKIIMRYSCGGGLVANKERRRHTSSATNYEKK